MPGQRRVTPGDAHHTVLPPRAFADAVVLLSGGLDSTTVLAMAQAAGFRCHTLAFRYGQRHEIELRHAEQIAKHAGAASFRVVDVDLRATGGSALTADIAVPKAGQGGTIPVTYVPARNTLFLAFALGVCEVINARDIFIGANAIDYSGYPDCRPEFIAAFERMANLGTKAGVSALAGEGFRVQAPLLHLSKAEIIRAGTALGVDYAHTWSCYDPQGALASTFACGVCDSCVLRKNGFAAAGVPDPTPYRR